MIAPAIPAPFRAILSSVPDAPRARLIALRDLIWQAAEATDTAPLSETLKWGQMAFLPPRRAGTTLRLGWSDKSPEVCRVFVHCQTDLVGRYQMLFPSEFSYEGSRAVCLPASAPFSAAAFQQIAGMALTYHREKKGAP